MLLGEFHQMQREGTEEMDKTLRRFAKNVQTKLQKNDNNKKSKKNKKPLSGQTAEEVVEGFEVVDRHSLEVLDIHGLVNAQFSNNMVVRVANPCYRGNGDTGDNATDDSTVSGRQYLSFRVVVNAPTVTDLHTFPKTFYTVHCPIVPVVQLEFSDDFRCLWYCEKSPKSADYRLVCTEKVFIPQLEHVHCAVKLFVYGVRFEPPDSSQKETYMMSGRSFVTYLQHAVMEYPKDEKVLNRMVHVRQDYLSLSSNPHAPCSSLFPPRDDVSLDPETAFLEHIHRNVYEQVVSIDGEDGVRVDRHCGDESDKSLLSRSLRVVSYNVLSDRYAHQESEKLKGSMYFYLQSSMYLHVEYRAQRVAYELLSYKADIIALQECDHKVFDQYLMPMLGLFGYTGHFTNKISSVLEGCAVFTRTKCRQLTVLAYFDFPFKNVLRDDEYLQRTLYRERPDLRDIVGGKLGTIGQILVCQYGQETTLVLGNTHLFYHPLASYIRLLQMQALLRRMQDIRERVLAWFQEQQQQQQQEVSLHSLRESLSRPCDDLLEDGYLIRERQLANQLVVHTSHESCVISDPYDVQTLSVKGGCQRQVGLIILGDLNTSPDSGLAEYLNL
jgi:hypothetical protein